ncbi:MAG TPA: OpgC protein, partial [Sulfitobacter sp.]|nr:OpgC protein [Sulfitobacter sp.]
MTQSSNRPDAQLIPIRRGVDLPRRARDPRIDAFRGLALIMIIIDHMPGNP